MTCDIFLTFPLNISWNGKQFSFIPPLLCSLFNIYFAIQWTLINNGNIFLSTLKYWNDGKPYSVNHFLDVVIQLITKLDCNSLNGENAISMNIAKLLNSFFYMSAAYFNIWELSFEAGHIPIFGNKVLLSHYMEKNKELGKKYQLVYLLPICRYLLETLIFYSIFSFTGARNLLLIGLSGLRHGDSSVRWLILTSH